MSSEVGAAWVGIIPALFGLLFLATVVWMNRSRLTELLANIKRVSAAGIEIELATEDLKVAKADQPVSDRAATVLEARLARNAATVTGRRVLWVDDHPKWNRAERRFLRSAGVQVDNSTSTADALDRFRHDEYDLVITDQKREGRKDAGEDLAKRLRQAGEHVPVVAYTGKLDPARPTPSVFQGITNKPDELMHMVLDVFERRQGT